MAKRLSWSELQLRARLGAAKMRPDEVVDYALRAWLDADAVLRGRLSWLPDDLAYALNVCQLFAERGELALRVVLRAQDVVLEARQRWLDGVPQRVVVGDERDALVATLEHYERLLRVKTKLEIVGVVAETWRRVQAGLVARAEARVA